MIKNFKLTLCYDGTAYQGWQKQGNTSNTIQGKMEALLSRILNQPIECNGAGRTDAGVHAKAQVCSFHAETEWNAERLLAEIRKYLPSDIGAVGLEQTDSRFHARLSATGKTYLYRIWKSELPNVFERKYVYFLPDKLDVRKMRTAAGYLCGVHDFTSFTANRHSKKSAVREIYEIKIQETADEIRMEFSGNGFLTRMVRILVGTLIEVGRGEKQAEDMNSVLEQKNRDAAGFTAPACGLILQMVDYPKE